MEREMVAIGIVTAAIILIFTIQYYDHYQQVIAKSHNPLSKVGKALDNMFKSDSSNSNSNDNNNNDDNHKKSEKEHVKKM